MEEASQCAPDFGVSRVEKRSGFEVRHRLGPQPFGCEWHPEDEKQPDQKTKPSRAVARFTGVGRTHWDFE
jgi:hypothetical protein